MAGARVNLKCRYTLDHCSKASSATVLCSDVAERSGTDLAAGVVATGRGGANECTQAASARATTVRCIVTSVVMYKQSVRVCEHCLCPGEVLELWEVRGSNTARGPLCKEAMPSDGWRRLGSATGHAPPV